MNALSEIVNAMARWTHRHRGLLLPAGAAACVLVLLVPLPPGLMDILLSANLALSALILLTAIYIATPLEFSVLPSLLLGATLLRLVLNVASTRLILTAGADGRTLDEAQLAAGQVIWAFGDFVTAGSLPVGVILFAIIVVIQFIVVTRGASRISEVHARFVLDAMPGKQMAIDAELAAGAISQQEATERRRQVAAEAEFYGAMDGASRFVRGDAIAAILILFVCILGGLFVGVVQYGWSWSQAAGLYAKLTIGDGLVTQIPAFIISVAAALVVTRSASSTNLGEQVVKQLISRPTVLAITAGFLAVLAMTSLPTLPLLAIGAGCVGLAVMLRRGSEKPAAAGDDDAKPAADSPRGAPRTPGAGQAVQADLSVDPLRIEMGYALVSLVDPPERSDLMDRIAAIRGQIAGELGLTMPPVRIRDNMDLGSHAYAIVVRGLRVAGGEVYPRQVLAVSDERVELAGRAALEGATGLEGVWIGASLQEQAVNRGYRLVESAAAVAAHLAEVVRTRAADLLSREQVAAMIEALKARCPSLVSEVSERFKTGQVHKVLRALLRERAPIRDLEAILESLSDWPGGADDVHGLCEHVRAALAPALAQQHCRDGKLYCVTLEESLEQTIGEHVRSLPRGATLTLGAELAGRTARALDRALAGLRKQGKSPVVLCSPAVRCAVRQLVAPSHPAAAVLAYGEVESVQVHAVESVSVES